MQFNVTDRVAVGDNKYTMTQLEDGRIMLEPAPDSVAQAGTPLNKETLQPLFDASPVTVTLIEDSNGNITEQNNTPLSQVFANLQNEENATIAVTNGVLTRKYFIYSKTSDRISAFCVHENAEFDFTFNGLFFSGNGVKLLIFDSDGTISVKERYDTDRVIETLTTTDGWTYRKWASGIAECWGVTTIKFNTTMASNGNYAVTGEMITVTLPDNLFNQSPVVSLTPMGGGYSDINIGNIYNTYFTVSFRTEWAVTDMPNWVQCICYGRWK